MKEKRQTVTRNGDKGHFGHADLRVTIANAGISWKAGETGNNVLTVNSGKPSDGERWIEITAAEFGAKSSREAMVAVHGPAARAVYEYLRDCFEGDAAAPAVPKRISFICIGNTRSWGRGATVAKAIANMKRECGSRSKPTQWHTYQATAETYVNEMGGLNRPAGHPPAIMVQSTDPTEKDKVQLIEPIT